MNIRVLLYFFLFDFSFDSSIKVIHVSILIHPVLKPFFFLLMFIHLPMVSCPFLHQVFGHITLCNCVGAQILVLLFIIFIQTHCVHKMVSILLRSLKFFADATSLRIKNIEFIGLYGPYEVISWNHPLLIHKIIPIDLPYLQLHFAMVSYQVLPNLLLVCFVATPNGANAILQELRLKISFQINIWRPRSI